jgi:hypothetical protein
MNTLQEVDHQAEAQEQRTRRWALIAIAVVAVLAIAGVAWIVVSDNGTSDIDVATELVDTWARGWVENDPDVVGSVFTDDAIYSDNVPGFHFPGVWTKEEHMRDVQNRGDAIRDTRRVSELTETDDGTFTFVMEFTVNTGVRHSGLVEIELDGDLASRIEWLNLERLAGS